VRILKVYELCDSDSESESESADVNPQLLVAFSGADPDYPLSLYTISMKNTLNGRHIKKFYILSGLFF
jgi:hypothetical protein